MLLNVLAQINDLTGSGQVESVIDLMMKGGIIMIPIILLSLISVYIFFDKLFYIRNSAKIDAGFVPAIITEIKNKKPENAINLAKNQGRSVGRIMESGLEQLGKPVKEVEHFMESTTNIEVAQMEKNTGYLGIIAGIAPMLGFVGTIAGVIKIFYGISMTDNISIGIIAGGLYQKMICSGTGLIVGVIAYAAYHYLQIRIDKFTHALQKNVLEFMKSIE